MNSPLSAPGDPVTQALLALKKGDFAAARSLIRASAPRPRDTRHFLIEGLATLAMADWPDADAVFRAATEAFPGNAQFWFNRGLAEENLGRPDDAEASYQRSLGLKPGQGEIFGNLSNIYRKQGRFSEAVQMACRAVASDVPKAHALNVLGLALGKQGNFTEAQGAFDEAIAIAPQDGSILANRANLAVDQLKFDEAWEFFARARAADDSPVIRRDEGMARLLAGDYAKGLPLYEARLELPNALRVQPACPRWKGEPLSGKSLLLVSEQGFGDTIQFSRYANRFVEAGADLIWVVRQPLQRLLAANLPGRVIAEGSPLPHADFWLPILSLPYALGMTSATPSSAPFHSPTEPKLPNPNGKRKIGLVWSGSPTHERDHERSIPLSMLVPLWAKSDAQFFAPFKGAGESLKDANAPIIPLDHLIADFADMAALLSQLDCLIAVDTAAAHLAGALNIKTYLLLPHCPDWRWGASGKTTNWHPTMTLLRQPRYGDWDSVVESLIEKI
jgi:tetratricopeptide (TPR) repeat protein